MKWFIANQWNVRPQKKKLQKYTHSCLKTHIMQDPNSFLVSFYFYWTYHMWVHWKFGLNWTQSQYDRRGDQLCNSELQSANKVTGRSGIRNGTFFAWKCLIRWIAQNAGNLVCIFHITLSGIFGRMHQYRCGCSRWKEAGMHPVNWTVNHVLNWSLCTSFRSNNKTIRADASWNRGCA